MAGHVARDRVFGPAPVRERPRVELEPSRRRRETGDRHAVHDDANRLPVLEHQLLVAIDRGAAQHIG